MGLPKLLVFDVDGTLFRIKDYIPIFRKAQYEALKTLNPSTTISFKDVAELYSPLRLPHSDSARYLETVWHVNPEKYWDLLAKLELRDRKIALQTGAIQVFGDVSVLRKLKTKHQMALLSNTPEESVNESLAHFGLLDLFEDKVCAKFKCELTKPGVKGITVLLEKAGVKPPEAWMIGDSEIDVAAGRNAGMFTVQITRDHQEEEGKPDLKISSFYELAEALSHEANR